MEGRALSEGCMGVMESALHGVRSHGRRKAGTSSKTRHACMGLGKIVFVCTAALLLFPMQVLVSSHALPLALVITQVISKRRTLSTSPALAASHLHVAAGILGRVSLHLP